MSVVLCVGRDLLIPLLYIGVMAILPSTHGEYLVTMMQISAGGSKLLLETRRWMDGRESKPRLERSKKRDLQGRYLAFHLGLTLALRIWRLNLALSLCN